MTASTCAGIPTSAGGFGIVPGLTIVDCNACTSPLTWLRRNDSLMDWIFCCVAPGIMSTSSSIGMPEAANFWIPSTTAANERASVSRHTTSADSSPAVELSPLISAARRKHCSHDSPNVSRLDSVLRCSLASAAARASADTCESFGFNFAGETWATVAMNSNISVSFASYWPRSAAGNDEAFTSGSSNAHTRRADAAKTSDEVPDHPVMTFCGKAPNRDTIIESKLTEFRARCNTSSGSISPTMVSSASRALMNRTTGHTEAPCRIGSPSDIDPNVRAKSMLFGSMDTAEAGTSPKSIGYRYSSS